MLENDGALILWSNTISTDFGSIKPLIIFKKVLFPEPDIPVMHIISPLEILIESDLLTKTKPGLGKSIIGNIVIRLATVAKKQPN